METKDKYVVICPKNNIDLLSFISKEKEEDDVLIPTMLHKFPSRDLEKIYYDVKKKYDYLIILNSNSRYFIDGFLSNLKKYKSSNGISFKRTDDFPCETKFELLSNKLVMSDDSLCIPLKIFRGFRDISPQTLFPDMLKFIASRYDTYGDPARFIVGYNNIILEKRLLEDENNKIVKDDKNEKEYERNKKIRLDAIKIFWKEEIKKRKQEEERMIRTIPKPVKKINKNGTVNIISKVTEKSVNSVTYKGNWNDWMLNN
jgi:hypothetical protein